MQRRSARWLAGLAVLGLMVWGAGCGASEPPPQDVPLAGDDAAPSPKGTSDAGDAPDVIDASSDGGAAVPSCIPGPDAGTPGNGDVTIGPTYADAPELTVAAGVPRGTVFRMTMSSTASTIYPGLTGPYMRSVSIYIPKQYVDGTDAPLLVVQDGAGYVATVTPVLDTLIAQKRVPPMIAVLVDSGGGDGRGSERGLEYDRVAETYSRFVETELLPAIPTNAAVQAVYKNLRFTTNPDGRATMGGSSGGAAAFTMAWFHPERYRRILTYSGTFVNQYPEPAYPHGAWEYHEQLIPNAAPKPLRVFLEVGENDNNLDATFGDGEHNWITANINMAAVLAAKGYAYRFEYAKGATHVDGRVLRQTLPEALVWIWAGYPSCDPAAP